MLAGATWPSATHAQVSIDMARATCADYLALCSLLCVDERMVQSEDRLRIRRLERLCSKRRECELMVRFESDANRRGRPSARHGPDSDHRRETKATMKRNIVASFCVLLFTSMRQ